MADIDADLRPAASSIHQFSSRPTRPPPAYRTGTMADIDADLVLQVNRSHLERVDRFLRSHYTSLGDASAVGAPRIEFLATKRKTASKSCSLVYLRADDCKAFMEHLSANHRFVLQGVNKFYVMAEERSILRGSFPPANDGSDILDEEKHRTSHDLLKLMQQLRHDNGSNNKSVRVKVGVFPMKLQSNVVKNLSALMDAKNIPEDVLDVVPTGQTHTMSIVEMDAGAYLVGIATGSPPPIEKTNTTNDICRAFHKLSEAMQRYRHQHNPSFPLPKAAGCGKRRKCPKPMIAVDCGSAPGGWTKCLIEEAACDEVFSIDPGEMDESIASLPNVHHMKMKGAEAIPKLRSILAQRDELVSLWVSDMCVHEVPQQVDTFLLAFREGLFRPDAAFCVTIKCNVGHTSKRFEALAEAEANRLKRDAGAYGVSIMHLFNNRLGERTICGMIK